VSITSFYLIYAPEQSERGLNNLHKYSLAYLAESSDGADTADAVMAYGAAHGGFALGDVYRFRSFTDSASVCERIKPVQNRDCNKLWTVTYDFASQSGTQNNQSPEEPNPLLRLPKYSFHKEPAQKPAETDRNNKSVRNSAGCRFSNPVMDDGSRIIMPYTRNEETFPLLMAYVYWDSVNSGAFLGAEKGKMLCRSITGTRVWERWIGNDGRARFGYWEVTYEFAYDKDGWNAKRVDEGTLELDAGGKLVQPKDARGYPIAGPFLLDGKGKRMSDADVAAGKFNTLDFTVYAELDFSALNIVLV
jgi:hypothetical protein